MTERRFQVGRRMIQNKPWDFFMLCDIAPDRLHHVFWQFYDKRHPLYEACNQYEGIFQDYYRFLDRQLADFLELVPEDAVTIVMSDHGARPMMGGLCFMVNNTMCCTVSGRGGMLIRVGPEAHARMLQEPHTGPMEMRGRIMTGFVRVAPEGYRSEADLKRAPFIGLGAFPGAEPDPRYDGFFWLGPISGSPPLLPGD